MKSLSKKERKNLIRIIIALAAFVIVFALDKIITLEIGRASWRERVLERV